MINHKDQYGFFKNVKLDVEGRQLVSNDTSFAFEVNRGNIENTIPFNKFGRNEDIDTGSGPEDIISKGGVYAGFPTEIETMEILSTSSSDKASGNGAIIVEVSNLLDENFNEVDPVIVTLNGTTPVSLGSTTYTRASRIRVLSAGTSGYNVGKIILRHSNTTSNIFATIPPTLNQSQMFIYTVPVGKTLYIPNFSVRMARANGSAGSANVRIKLKSATTNNWLVVRNVEITDSQYYEFKADSYFIAPEKTDIKVTVEKVSDNNTIVTGEADGYLINNI